MKEIGISIYPDFDNQNQIKKQLDRVKELGYSRVFTSIQLGDLGFKNTGIGITDEFKFLFDYCDELGITTHVDINANMLKKIGSHPNNLKVIEDLKIKVLRVDNGFTHEEIAQMTNNPYGIIIEENASMLVFPKQRIETVVHKGNIKQYYACHNYFPLNETGLSYQDALDSAKLFQSYGIKVGIFIGSLYAGQELNAVGNHIVTIEEHRYKPSHIQAMELFVHDEYNYVIFGDGHPGYDELVRVSEVACYDTRENLKGYTYDDIEYENIEQLHCVEIPVWFNKCIDEEIKQRLLHTVFLSRADQPELMVRGTQSRGKCACSCYQPIERNAYSLVLVNEYGNRYNGELQIPLTDLLALQYTNVIGQVKPYGKRLVNLVKYGKVLFILREE